jgi:uncharacterized protein (DUF342 family)
MASGEHDLDTHLQMRPDDRALTATLRVGPKIPAESVSVSIFTMFLESQGVNARAIDRVAVESLTAEVLASPGVEHSAVVCRGQEPRNGVSQLLEWAPQIARGIELINRRSDALAAESTKSKVSAPESQEPVNFYKQSSFIIVQAGEQVATLTPPDPGEDGEDIFGKSIPAHKSPEITDLDPDTLSLVDESRVIALARGRLIFSGAERCVQRTLSIDEDVGFETGNINFPGPVEIGGGVRDRFVVRARGAVTVRKLVEAATIESQRDIVLERGAAGRETGMLRAERMVSSGYLEAVRVWCGQDCLVRHEITNCRVITRGMVRIPTGTIRGGLVCAAKGIETAVSGSPQDVRTELVVGMLDDLELLIRQSRSRSDETQSMLNEMFERQAMYKLSNGTGKLTPQQVKDQMKMDFDIAETHRWMSELDAASARLEENLRAAISPVMKTSQCIYAGVLLWLPGYRATFRNDLKGESLIRINRLNQAVIEYRGEVHPLSKFATVEPDQRVYQLPAASESDNDNAATAA